MSNLLDEAQKTSESSFLSWIIPSIDVKEDSHVKNLEEILSFLNLGEDWDLWSG
ncbi:hypothetical protein JHK85_022628 [Glycine max]|nr:hypothetical protein JHK85_022628 [Glycine max]